MFLVYMGKTQNIWARNYLWLVGVTAWGSRPGALEEVWVWVGLIAGGMDGVLFAHICVPVFPPVLRLWLFCSTMFLSLFPNPERPLDRARWEGADDSTQASPFGREFKKGQGLRRWAQTVLSLNSTSCVSLGKLFNLSGLLFSVWTMEIIIVPP